MNRDALGLQGTTSPQTSVHDCSHGHLLERVQPEPEFVGPSLGAHSYGAFTAPRHERRRKCLDKPHSHALRAPWWQDMSGNAMNAEKTVRPARSLAVRMTNERRRQVARATRRIRGEPPILRSRRIGNQHHSHGTRPQTSVDHPSSPRLLFRPRREHGYGNRVLDTNLRTLVTWYVLAFPRISRNSFGYLHASADSGF